LDHSANLDDGTGSFLYFLLEEVIKNRLKVVAG
jgi:hypothetical protein